MTAPAPDTNLRPRILLAEDDSRLAGAFARRLGAEYLAVDVVTSVADARAHEQGRAYACLVLDRLLPDGDVLELVREIDDRTDRPPIVLVSAVADEDDRLEGLRAGADDYVGKPVHLDELAVRVTRLLESPPTVDLEPFEPAVVGSVTLDPVRLRVRVGGEPLVLPAPQVLILRTLMGQVDRVVRADALVAVCDEHHAGVTTESLPTHVAALRHALAGRLVIDPAPRRGYVLHEQPAAPRRTRRILRRRPS